jgi:hypothetical protein
MATGHTDERKIEEWKAIASAAAEETVHKTLLAIGIDASDPIAAQRDFATMREVVKMVLDPNYRKDWEHVRWWREAMESLKNKGVIAFVGIVVAGLASALWLGLQDMFVGKH